MGVRAGVFFLLFGGEAGLRGRARGQGTEMFSFSLLPDLRLAMHPHASPVSSAGGQRSR
jgi:hypothetical protein